MQFTRDGLLKDLRENVVEVEFDKVNGQRRLMRCTLRQDMLPPSYLQEVDKEKTFHKENPDVIAVWDINKQAWRSFRIDSVLYAQALMNY